VVDSYAGWLLAAFETFAAHGIYIPGRGAGCALLPGAPDMLAAQLLADLFELSAELIELAPVALDQGLELGVVRFRSGHYSPLYGGRGAGNIRLWAV